MPKYQTSCLLVIYFLVLVSAQAASGHAYDPRVSDDERVSTVFYDIGMVIGPLEHHDTPEREKLWTKRNTDIQDYLTPRVQAVAKVLLEANEGTEKPLVCVIDYRSTKDGNISPRPRVDSPSKIFTSICRSAMLSLSSNSILKFPDGTRFNSNWDRLGLCYYGPGIGGDCPKLSQEELNNLMKLPIEQIRDILKLSPADIHQKLSKSE